MVSGDGARLGRIAGVAVHVDWSLLVVFSLITLGLGTGIIPAWHPDWSAALVWATALGAAVAFLASVLAHELSHALVGRANGIPSGRSRSSCSAGSPAWRTSRRRGAQSW